MQVHAPEDEPTRAARARVGMVLSGKWTLQALLGLGGMAAVYAATHRNGKRVAVKVLHPEFGRDEEIRKRFLQEGYAANTLEHEGAVSVLDDDVAPDGSAFIVMELLEGETLEARWEAAGRRLPVDEVLAAAEQLLDVLAAAHAKSVVHRDIKPDNLFWSRGRSLKVLDFGIAKVFEERPTRPSATRVGTIMGTPAFMAPEQARARWDEVDGRTDLWAVGATMFTLLSGRYVHEADNEREQLILSATRRAPPLASVEPSVPAMVAAIVDRALAFEREARWPDAMSMRAAVRIALDALGGFDPAAAAFAGVPGRRLEPGSPLSGVRSSAVMAATATAIDTIAAGSPLSAWTKERELRAAVTVKLRASLAQLQAEHASAKKCASDARAKVEAGRTERSSLEQWFKRQAGTRTAAVEQARFDVRRHRVSLARRAISDRSAFGPDFDPLRAQIAKLELAAASAARDVRIHDAALHAYDARSVRRGIVLAAVLVLLLIVVPIVWRATRVVMP